MPLPLKYPATPTNITTVEQPFANVTQASKPAPSPIQIAPAFPPPLGAAAPTCKRTSRPLGVPQARPSLPLLAFTFSLSALQLFSPSLHARIGDTPELLEKRLLQPGIGKTYHPPAPPPAPNKNHRQQQQSAEKKAEKENTKLPFHSLRPFLPAGIRESIYWKTALSTHLDNENGWKIHIFYWNNLSALEAYQRVGEALNEFEIKSILALNRRNSTWIPKPAVPDEKTPPTGIDYTYELADHSLRAKVEGNWLLLFSTQLDLHVFEKKRQAREQAEQDAAQLRQSQQQSAPASTKGF